MLMIGVTFIFLAFAGSALCYRLLPQQSSLMIPLPNDTNSVLLCVIQLFLLITVLIECSVPCRIIGLPPSYISRVLASRNHCTIVPKLQIQRLF